MNISNMINKEIDKRVSNKKQETIKYYIKICLTLLIISAVTAGLLAFVNSMTKDRIAANELAVMEEALGRIFEGCDEIKMIKGEYELPVNAVYEVYEKGQMLGYGIQSTPVGFKEGIGLIVGADADGKCLGVEITSISDTPGVGTKVKDSYFLSGFKGLDGDGAKVYDTISGATISSKAVRSGVAAALALDIFNGETIPDETVEAPSENESVVPEETTEIPAETAGETTDENETEVETETSEPAETIAETVA